MRLSFHRVEVQLPHDRNGSPPDLMISPTNPTVTIDSVKIALVVPYILPSPQISRTLTKTDSQESPA